MKQKASGASVNISGDEVRVSGNSGSIVVGSRGVSVNGSVSGTVVTGDEVWINGEKCHPQSLIEELDEAYREILQADGAPLVDGTALECHGDAMRRLRRVRRILGLT